MQAIVEPSMLLRAQIELPGGLNLVVNEFSEGWDFAQSVDARRLETKIVAQGWSFTRIADGLLRSGVGETSQEAVSGALKLALRRISAYFNAVEVKHIELTQYPWFFLARVRVYPFRIQQGAALPIPEEDKVVPAFRRQRSQPIDAEVLFPHFGGALPELKQMLISSQGSRIIDRSRYV
jgi:hypothetical protein